MYRSPFTILPALAQGPLPGRSELLLERRKLQAEFELQGTDSIIVNGHELHRQDITTLFDELQGEDSLAFHRAVSDQPALRSFLEHGSIGNGAAWSAAPLEDWAEKISPLFAAAQNTFYKRLITGGASPEALRHYERLPRLILPQDTEEAYRNAGRMLLEKKNSLLQLVARARGNAVITEVEIKGWATPAQVALINALPGDFSQLRYLIADALNNLCVAFDKTKKYKLALRSIEAAVQIHVEGGELRSLIPRNLQLIRKRRSNILNQPYWWIIVGIVVLLRIFLSLGKSDRSPNSTIDRYLRDQQEHRLDDIRPELADTRAATYESLLRAINNSRKSGEDPSIVMRYNARKPRLAGDNPYTALFTSFVKTGADAAPVSTRPLRVCNKSSWGFILLCQMKGSSWSHAWYIPPGECYTAGIPDAGLRLNGYAGRDWSASRIQPFDYHTSPTGLEKSILLGGYTKLPTNATAFLPGGRLARTLDSAGHEVFGTLQIEDGSRNQILLREANRLVVTE